MIDSSFKMLQILIKTFSQITLMITVLNVRIFLHNKVSCDLKKKQVTSNVLSLYIARWKTKASSTIGHY